jgi:hypothetical protein
MSIETEQNNFSIGVSGQHLLRANDIGFRNVCMTTFQLLEETLIDQRKDDRPVLLKTEQTTNWPIPRCCDEEVFFGGGG